MHPSVRAVLPLAVLAAVLATAIGVCSIGCGGAESAEAQAPDPAGPDDGGTDAAEPAPDLAPTPETAAPDGGDEGLAPDAAPDVPAGPPKVADLAFSEPQPWATPIEDYLAAGFEELGHWGFQRGVQDLVVYLDRLYLGYGDATYNLGRVVPIELRYFPSPDAPAFESDFVTDEEQILRYRVLLGQDLFAPGVDATEDAWLGNVYYRRPEEGWVKGRTLEGGVHVHDTFDLGGHVYAVGSGAMPEEWTAGDIYSHLWVSKDAGATFEVLTRSKNVGKNLDSRWTRLLPVGDTLYVFGYKLTSNNPPAGVIDNGRLVGGEVVPLEKGHGLAAASVEETDRIDAALGVVRGIDLTTQDPRRFGVWLVAPGDAVTKLGRFDEETVVDLYPHEETGETLLLTYDGNDVAAAGGLSEWFVRIYVTADFEKYEMLTGFYAEEPPKSVAFWQGGLYYGTDHGAVLRSPGQPPR